MSIRLQMLVRPWNRRASFGDGERELAVARREPEAGAELPQLGLPLARTRVELVPYARSIAHGAAAPALGQQPYPPATASDAATAAAATAATQLGYQSIIGGPERASQPRLLPIATRLAQEPASLAHVESQLALRPAKPGLVRFLAHQCTESVASQHDAVAVDGERRSAVASQVDELERESGVFGELPDVQQRLAPSIVAQDTAGPRARQEIVQDRTLSLVAGVEDVSIWCQVPIRVSSCH